MRIVMLIENTAATSRLAVQHGLSVFIEGERESYLFGLGGDSKLLSNAARLKLSVKSVQKAVISHNRLPSSGQEKRNGPQKPRQSCKACGKLPRQYGFVPQFSRGGQGLLSYVQRGFRPGIL